MPGPNTPVRIGSKVENFSFRRFVGLRRHVYIFIKLKCPIVTFFDNMQLLALII